ncbi:MAG: dephospho-CoA kinase [Synechococcales bacterium]|nr:dephospho-CoA kinase [Synechococcales bacterium]
MAAVSNLPLPIGVRVIGVTGGIAMGKSTLSNYLEKAHQLPVFDADRYAREAVAPGSEILQAIATHFGAAILQPDGSLDRKALGQIVFNHAQERHWLEEQIHPFVRYRLQTERDRALQDDPQRPVFLMVPLLFEAEMTDLVTEIWVVYCPEEQQIQRLMQRESLSWDQAQARMTSQMEIQKKCDRAHLVLDNSLTIEFLLSQVDRALAS